MFDESYDSTYGGLVGLTRSRTSTGHSLSVQVVNKTRYVWRVYLEKEQVNLAIRHCEDQQAAMDLILT